MEKSKQLDKNYTSISQHESFILSLMKQQHFTVFSIDQLYHLSGWNKNRLYNTLFSLVKKNILTRIKRDAYIVCEKMNEHLFQIATEAVIPSYISFWTALSYYGFTEQQIKTIQVVSTKQRPPITFNAHFIQIYTFQPRAFYGYTKRDGFVIAEEEKALIDSLYQLQACGGLTEYIKCLSNAWGIINKKTLIQYLKMFQNKSLISRIGFLIEQLELDKASLIQPLQSYTSSCPIKLNPMKHKTHAYNKKWNIIINDSIKKEEIY